MLAKGERAGFLWFSTSTNIVFNFKSLYYLYFLTNVLNIPIGVAGTILTIGTVWDAVNDPLIGLFAVNHTFKSGEKVRPFAFWCSFPWAITIVLLFSNFNLGRGLTIALALVVYFLFEALYTGMAIPYNSMGALASNLDSDRKSINAYRSLGGCFGSGIGSVAVVPLVKLFGGLKTSSIIGPEDAPALFKTACLMGVICIAGALSHYYTTEERVKPQDGNESEEKLGLIEAYRMLFKCRSWVQNMFYVICYGISTALVMQMINYYCACILGDSSRSTPILAIYLVMAVLLSIFTPAIDKKIGRKKTMVLGCAVAFVGKIPFILNPYSMMNIYINAFTVGIGLTITFVMFNTNRNNIADVLELINGRRIDSMVATGDNLASKLAEAGAIQLMTLALSKAGYIAEAGANQTAATNTTICAFLGWVPAIVALIMTLVVWNLDTQKELEKYKK